MSDEDIYQNEETRAQKLKEQREEEDRQKIRRKLDFQKILKTPEGRRTMWWLLSNCGVFRNSFSANSNQTAYNEGRRDVGLMLLGEVNKADRTVYAQMQNEHWSEKEKRQEAE